MCSTPRGLRRRRSQPFHQAPSNYTNNLISSVNLINASVNTNRVKCFVFTSSIAVYGPNQVPMTEELTPMPEDPYGIAKYAVEMDLKEAHEMFGLNSVIFRPHNVYGEQQRTSATVIAMSSAFS